MRLNTEIIPQYTADDFYNSSEPYQFLYQFKDDKFKLGQMRERMKEYADMFMRISKNPTVDYTEKYKDKISNETYEKIAVENNTVTDNETVFCPVCGSPMVKRVAKRGNNIGNEFYGCTQFPKCRGIIQIK